jgi:hypothetical protein
MPLKLNVGLAKKVGQPDYGSLCASCHVECELDSMLLASDPDRFQEYVRDVFVACSQAIHDELSRQRNANGDGQAAKASRPRTTAAAARSAPAGKPPTNGQSHHASSKQLEYARQLAGQIRELGVGQLDQLAGKMHGKALSELTSLEASSLIDMLKAVKEGKIDIGATLAGGGP